MIEEIYKSGEYLQNNPTWHVGESAWKAREILRMMERNAILPTTVCEVGCGVGENLRLLQEKMSANCEYWGYEISPQAFELCQSRSNEKLHFKLQDFKHEKSVNFDLILVMDVLEHLEDYFGFLRDIKSKSQYKIIQLPMDLSVRSILRSQLLEYRKLYGHLHYFTKETALQMLKDAGYEVLDCFYTYEFDSSTEFIPNETVLHPIIRLRKLLGKIRWNFPKQLERLAFAVHEDLAVRIIGSWRLLILVK